MRHQERKKYKKKRRVEEKIITGPEKLLGWARAPTILLVYHSGGSNRVYFQYLYS
jgi:hypothetical protein